MSDKIGEESIFKKISPILIAVTIPALIGLIMTIIWGIALYLNVLNNTDIISKTFPFEHWGTIGDFFGGILNPAFSLISIGLLVFTLLQTQKSLKQNEKALRQNEEALRLNNDELSISSEALKSSAEAQHSQAISNNFFSLLAQHNNIVHNLSWEGTTERAVFNSVINTITKRSIIEARKLHRNGTIPEVTADEINSEYLDIQKKKNDILGHYFRNLFQIIKYIDEYSDLETELNKASSAREAQKKNFLRILRAQLSSNELLLLLINCQPGMVDEGQFRYLLIKYEMLKHVHFENLSEDGQTVHLTDIKISKACFCSYFIDDTEKSAFGDNKIAKQIRNRIKNKKAGYQIS